jgi:hypothetical protein
LPNLQRGLIQLLFLLPDLKVILLPTCNFSQKLQRLSILRPQLNHILECIACMRKCVVFDVLARQAKPVIDLLIGAAALNAGSQAECFRVSWINLQHFLQLLQRQRVFLLFEARASVSDELGQGILTKSLLDSSLHGGDCWIKMTFGLKLAQYFRGKLQIVLL